MKRFWIITSIVISITSLIAICFLVTSTYKQLTASAQVEKPTTISELLVRINEERQKVGSGPLTIDVRLNNSAQRKADEIIYTGAYSHVNSKGVHGYQYAQESTGKECYRIGENIAYDENKGAIVTTDEAIQSWMKSESHRSALLDKSYKTTGFGITNGAIVEHFCQP